MSLYTELAKKVHPDINPGMQDATERMQEVNKFKEYPEVLLRLAKEWGLKLDGEFNEKDFDKKFDKNTSDYQQRVYKAMVGAIIRHSVRHKDRIHWIRGIIVGIRSIRKGQYKGAKEYSIYDLSRKGIWKLKTFNDNAFSDIIGMAPKELVMEGKNIVYQNKMIKKREISKSKKDANDAFRKLGLHSNYSYTKFKAGRFKILVDCGQSYGFKKYTVLRTTGKSVYVTDKYPENASFIMSIDKKDITRFSIYKVVSAWCSVDVYA